jgi:uncharacterized membrane protein (UPF0127 family)
MKAPVGLALLCLAPCLALADPCSPDRVEFRGPKGQSAFTVELARSPEERSIGLMNRQKLGASSGMLFVYEAPQPVAFWMENTLIPLDMVFLRGDGTVETVHAMAQPLDRTPIPGGDDIQFVVEINGGLAARLGIGPGDAMRSPLIDQARAAWPCAN